MNALYPPSPKTVPKDFTEPSTRYEWQVFFVLCSLILTLLLYLALVVGTGWALYQLVTLPWPRKLDGGYLILRILGLFCSAFLFLYLFKGLFKTQGRDPAAMVEVFERNQPDLFAFLRQLCVETGAPFPRRIFVSHEVNACVFYPSSLASLVCPRRKNLLIGLGLVQTFNLTELKAVLAHELGHFSQSSMQLGSYVYMANNVLADIVYGRDFLDQFLGDMKSWDEPFAMSARVFEGLLRYLRLALEAVFKGINLLNYSLMRQMEFNADRFAVKTAGSDALGQSLERCQYAEDVFGKLEADLAAAGDHKLYSNDIFAHFETVATALARRRKNSKLGVRPSAFGPDTFIFTRDKDEHKTTDMWSTHPSNYERERQAKAIYLPVETDTRSAWLLFREPAVLRQSVSRCYYERVHELPGGFTSAPAAKVQEFLDAEYAETTYDARYQGYYDGRQLELKDLYALPTRTSFLKGRDALEEIDAIHESLVEWMSAHRRRQGEKDRLEQLLPAQEPRGRSGIEFHGQQRPVGELWELLNRINGELEKDRLVQVEGDARIYLAHQLLAREVGCDTEFEQRYQFQVQAQNMHGKIVEAMTIAGEVLDYADGCNGEMSEAAFANVVNGFREALSRLNEVSMASIRFRMPALKNMTPGQPLSEFLGLGSLVDQVNARVDCIESDWIEDLLGRLEEVEDRLHRLTEKNLGGILTLQESIVRDWRERKASEPEQPAAVGKRPWH